jgi:cellulose synthase/poly-beta-1,6-N-acetylglucosamine synthase-like glycosyltransferase
MSLTAVSGFASVIIPCWNQLEFTRKCVAALMRQTGPNWELIVVNNGSNDGTAEYLAGVQDVSPVPVTVMICSFITSVAGRLWVTGLMLRNCWMRMRRGSRSNGGIRCRGCGGWR